MPRYTSTCGTAAHCTLKRDADVLAEGHVGPLPEVVLPILLRVGDRLDVTTEDQAGSPARYSDRGALLAPASIPCTLQEVFAAARPGQSIWFDDGKIGGVVRSVDAGRLSVEVTYAGPEGSKLRAGEGHQPPRNRTATCPP